MKVYSLIAFALLVVASAQDEEQQGTNCDQICEERLAPVVREKDELWHIREALIKEKDELSHSLEAIIKEKDELWHSREAIIKEKDELAQHKDRALQDAGQVGVLKQELEKKESEMAHYQKVAQDNQKYMQEYKNQLAIQRDRAAKLNTALQEATAKIEELENTTFFAKLHKEVSVGWGKIADYWETLRNKGEKEL